MKREKEEKGEKVRGSWMWDAEDERQWRCVSEEDETSLYIGRGTKKCVAFS